MRIRSVKPEFYRHEGLSDLENNHPQARPMLVFEGLWGVSDSQGVFPWSARVLKLDILPLVEFDIDESLRLLEEAGFICRFQVGGKLYGHVMNFHKHQRLSGKEAVNGKRYPSPADGEATEKQPSSGGEAPEQQRGSDGEATGKHPGAQEGKGREGKGEGQFSPSFFPSLREINPGVALGAMDIARLQTLREEHGWENLLEAYRKHQKTKPGQALRFFFEDLGKYLPKKKPPRKEPEYPSTAICPDCGTEAGTAPGEDPGTYICRACSKDLPAGEWKYFRAGKNGKHAEQASMEAAELDPTSIW